MSAALNVGLDHFLGPRRSRRPLRAVLAHWMKPSTGAFASADAPLAGCRILLAGEQPAVAGVLREGGAEVIQARSPLPLTEQLPALPGVDALVLALESPAAMLAAARAVRAGAQPWASIPLLGLAADPDASAAAARAAGIDGLLARPVETILLYETLTRFISASAARAQRGQAPAASVPAATVVPEPLLNTQRLESYQRLGVLDELVNDYLPEMKRLLAALHDAAARADVQGTLSALHSLLGMSGEAGAQGLYVHVRKLYVPLLEHGQWPLAGDWLAQLRQLASRTEEALKAYCARQAPSSAA